MPRPYKLLKSCALAPQAPVVGGSDTRPSETRLGIAQARLRASKLRDCSLPLRLLENKTAEHSAVDLPLHASPVFQKCPFLL